MGAALVIRQVNLGREATVAIRGSILISDRIKDNEKGKGQCDTHH